MFNPFSQTARRQALTYGAVVAMVLALCCALRLFHVVDNSFYDLLQQQLADAGPGAPPEIVVVTIDEDSITSLKHRYPWPRSIFAQLLQRLYAGGATAVGLDVLFIGDTEPAEDTALVAALQAAPKTVLAAKLESIDSQPAGSGAHMTGQRLVLPGLPLRPYATFGLLNFELESDGVLRRFSGSFRHQDQDYLTFSNAVYQTAYGHAPPLPPGGSGYINYVGPPYTSFKCASVAQVLNGTCPPDFFRGKIVLVGSTLLDQHDFFATPLGGDKLSPGVEIHANLLADMMRGSYCRHAARWPQVLLVLLLVAGFTALRLWRRTRWAIATGAATWVLLFVGAWWSMSHSGVFFDVSYALAAVPLALVAVSWPLRRPVQVLETSVGPYKLLEELGRGGMAVVYRARHPRTKREVALKQVLPEYITDETIRQRFLREVEVVRNLNHPNIIEIIDAGEVAGTPYYAMAIVNGPTLERRLQELKHFPCDEVRRLGAAVARALARAHARGLLHRDIKPANIMLDEAGEPKLMDFGIARKINDVRLTQTGELMGTPLYLAPEQIQGMTASFQSDIYSLGATLYHLVAGQAPFYDEEIHIVLNKCLTEEPPPLSQFVPDADPELEEILLQCLNKGPRLRPASMAELATRLDPLYTGEIDPPPAPPADGPPTAPAFKRKRFD